MPSTGRRQLLAYSQSRREILDETLPTPSAFDHVHDPGHRRHRLGGRRSNAKRRRRPGRRWHGVRRLQPVQPVRRGVQSLQSVQPLCGRDQEPLQSLQPGSCRRPLQPVRRGQSMQPLQSLQPLQGQLTQASICPGLLVRGAGAPRMPCFAGCHSKASSTANRRSTSASSL
jgi:hypothetical protein